MCRGRNNEDPPRHGHSVALPVAFAKGRDPMEIPGRGQRRMGGAELPLDRGEDGGQIGEGGLLPEVAGTR